MSIIEDGRKAVSDLYKAVNVLSELRGKITSFWELTSDMTETLRVLRRKHKVDCGDLPLDTKDMAPGRSFCGCGADEMNLHIERMAWALVQKMRELDDQEKQEWDPDIRWTEVLGP